MGIKSKVPVLFPRIQDAYIAIELLYYMERQACQTWTAHQLENCRRKNNIYLAYRRREPPLPPLCFTERSAI